MEILLAGFDNQTKSAATLAPLRSVVERSCNFHLLQSVWVGQGDCVEVSEIEIVHVDSLERHTVVTGALTVHGNIGGTATGTAHIRRIARDAG